MKTRDRLEGRKVFVGDAFEGRKRVVLPIRRESGTKKEATEARDGEMKSRTLHAGNRAIK